MKILENFFWLIVVLVMATNGYLHFHNLTKPDWKVFDEVYYPKYAETYFSSETYFDVHPPLGKLIIAGGVKIFGHNFMGYRSMESIFGLGLILVICLVSLKIFKNKATALVALVLASVSSMIFVESRFGLINIFLAFFITLALYFYWDWISDKKPLYLIFALFFLALASSVKWTGFLALLGLSIFELIKVIKYKSFTKNIIHYLMAILLFVGVYVGGFYLANKSEFKFVEWHKQAWGFHINLKETHPYQSRWWTWPLGIRPIWLEYKNVGDNLNIGVIEIENIVILWFGVASFIYALFLIFFDKKNEKSLFLVIFISSLFFPWMFVHRVTFLYLFLPVIPLLIILESDILVKLLYSKITANKILACTILILAVSFFVYFYPLLVGQVTSYQNYQNHMWMKSWY